MTLIGLVGNKGVGKDTVADYLVKKHGFTKTHFAGPLKKGVQQWFGFTDEQLYTDLKEEIDENWGVSPREVFQVVGTDIVRDKLSDLLKLNMGNNFWLNTFDIWYLNGHETDNVVVADVRFQNEVDYILQNGGYVIRVFRTGREQIKVLEAETENNIMSFVKDLFGCSSKKKRRHISEQTEYLTNIPIFLAINFETKEDLYDSVEFVYNNIEASEKEINDIKENSDKAVDAIDDAINDAINDTINDDINDAIKYENEKNKKENKKLENKEGMEECIE